ncbi:acyl carrier protein [Pseudomonas serboccidentalis]|uniref:Acyl carrier protein n=1 Tax=Pseudomonas serboccidentalis TaxID=2964670 RepID=A0ABY7Z5R3_9PSED|nr:acyl carrier protein [Pseudomonas serboccidentalis]WDR34996.1 acyl carrier protein [Pseudomonas serboccidentalis]
MVDLVKMRASIAEILFIPLAELRGETVLENSDNWDSMARIGIVALVFEQTGVSVSGEEIERVVTVQDLFDLIDRKIKDAA